MAATFPHFLAVATALGLLLAGGTAHARAGDVPGKLATPTSRLDRSGDPLPEGALYRVGPSRFRAGYHVSFLAFSKDGKTLLSVNRLNDHSRAVIRRWETSTGKQLRQFPLPIRLIRKPETFGEVYDVALSPDGAFLAALPVGAKEPILILDAVTGRVVRRFGKQMHGSGIAFSADGRTLATTDEEGVVHLWNPATGAARGKMTGRTSCSQLLTFSPDGKLLSSSEQHLGGSDKTRFVHLWDTTSRREIRCFRPATADLDPGAICFSPDGKLLAVRCYGSIELWSPATSKLVRILPLKDSGWFSDILAFSPDGKLVATHCGHFLLLWNVENGKEAFRWKMPYGSHHCMAFSPDGKLLALGGENISLWQVATGKELLSRGEESVGITSAVFAPDGKLLATGGSDDFLRLWDASTGAFVRRIKACPDGNHVIGFTPDGQSLLSEYIDHLEGNNEYFQWDRTTGRVQRHIKPPGKACYGVLSPSGRILAWQDPDKTLHFRDVASRKDVYSWRCDQTLFLLRFSPDETLMAATRSLRQSQSDIWEVATGKVYPRFEGEEQLIAFSPDARVVAREDSKGRIHFQTTRTAKAIACTRLEDVIPWTDEHVLFLRAAVFSPDGKTLATAYQFEPIRLWETATGKERLRIPVERGYVHQLSFSPDGGKLLRVSSEDNAVVWQLLGRAPGQTPAALSEKQLRTLWTELASSDGQAAFRALRHLSAAAPGPVAAFFRRELERKPPHKTQQQIARWIAQLDADQFDVREKASRELAQLGDVAEPLLNKALHDRPSPEKRRRLQALLSKLARALVSKNIRRGRMIEVLEHLAAPEADKLLKTLAQGEPNDRLAQEARAALGRLVRRTR